jgi:anti-sigma regulatory factor (Ser/Thr protein kinase)
MVAGNTAETSEDQLTLTSRMSELSRLPDWLVDLAARHGIPENIQFAADLCLEEIVSNVIRHGYSGQPGHSLVVRFLIQPESFFVFVIEDQAPHFNPLDLPEPVMPESLQDIRVGGQGIHLVRKFADALEYEPLQGGNRLTMGFSAAKAEVSTS